MEPLAPILLLTISSDQDLLLIKGMYIRVQFLYTKRCNDSYRMFTRHIWSSGQYSLHGCLEMERAASLRRFRFHTYTLQVPSVADVVIAIIKSLLVS